MSLFTTYRVQDDHISKQGSAKMATNNRLL